MPTGTGIESSEREIALLCHPIDHHGTSPWSFLNGIRLACANVQRCGSESKLISRPLSSVPHHTPHFTQHVLHSTPMEDSNPIAINRPAIAVSTKILPIR